MKELLKLENVVKFYPPNCRAVNDVSLSICSKQAVSIYGPGGSGKTTLMKLISGLEQPDSGKITLWNKEIRNMSDDELSALRSKNIGLIAKDMGLINELTVYENAVLPFSVRKIDKEKYANEANSIFKILGLENIVHALPKNISPYQRCLTCIARAIITKPELLLFDEFDYYLSDTESVKIWDILSVILTFSEISAVFFTNEVLKKSFINRTFKIQHGKIEEVLK